MNLNEKESAVLSYMKETGRPVKIREISAACFGDVSPEKGDSFVRNSLRKLRDEMMLVEKTGRGTYSLSGDPQSIEQPAKECVTKVDMSKLESVQHSIRTAVYRTAGSVLSQEEIDDTVQTINEQLAGGKLAKFNADRSQLATFVYTVARSATIDILKRRPKVQFVEVDECLSSTAEDVLTTLIKHEQAEAVRRAIASLSPDEQELAAVFYDDDFSMEEFAAKHGVKLESVWSRKCRLQKKIRDLVRANADLL